MMAEPTPNAGSRRAQALYIASLMLAGESIYLLPYLRKTFQTSMELVFNVSATEIGLLNSMFGVLALLCYFPGGWLADRFSARRLLTTSLAATGLGGLYLASVPAYPGLLAVHAFWGVVTILTFWAALIKATRAWGSTNTQGLSFGLLDGGRGLVAALAATAGTLAFALAGSPHTGLTAVILVYSLLVLLAAAAVWWLIPDSLHAQAHRSAPPALAQVRRLLASAEIWLLAAVVMAAYLLYLGTFEFPAYAERGYQRSKVFGAALGTVRDWLRPVAAVAAGLLADRIRPTRAVAGMFALLAAAYASLWWLPPTALPLLWCQVMATSLGAFALRGIYFALLAEAGIPLALTGTAVGLISVVGFAPDAFGHLLAGWYVDSAPGAAGYRDYFGFLAVVALAGLGAALAISWRVRQNQAEAIGRPLP